MTVINLLPTVSACVNIKLLQLCLTPVTLWTIACQVPQPMGFSRQIERGI